MQAWRRSYAVPLGLVALVATGVSLATLLAIRARPRDAQDLLPQLQLAAILAAPVATLATAEPARTRRDPWWALILVLALGEAALPWTASSLGAALRWTALAALLAAPLALWRAKAPRRLTRSEVALLAAYVVTVAVVSFQGVTVTSLRSYLHFQASALAWRLLLGGAIFLASRGTPLAGWRFAGAVTLLVGAAGAIVLILWSGTHAAATEVGGPPVAWDVAALAGSAGLVAMMTAMGALPGAPQSSSFQ